MHVVMIWLLASCAGDGTCDVIEEGDDRVVVGFWDNDQCSGEPVATNSFPVDGDAECYCWPGSSGENSADSFTCGDDSFTYTQFNSLTCGEDDDSPAVKTVYTDRCEQDIPPTLYLSLVG
ncbi:MAG: hypothetical protein ACI8S6_000040 [Myxococcota bacterium]|jgi:hypothetical protein